MRGSTRIWLVVAAFAVACGSNEGVPELSVSDTNFCDELAEVACHDMYNCCSEGEIESVLGVDEPRTQGQCREDVAVQCRRAVATFDWSVENGRAQFEAASAQTCLSAFIAEDQCEVVATTRPWEDDCVNELWTGLVADGAQCFQSYECAGADSYCAANRTCTPLPGDGMTCGVQGCATGLFCDSGTCRPRRAAGEACDSTIDCVVGLFCDFTADPDPVCAARHAVGEACTGDTTCLTGDCIPGVCNASGQTCFEDSDCTGRCDDDGSFCTVDSQCGLGACSIGATVCDEPLDCAGEGNTCVFPVACVPGDCVGDPVCGETYFTTDFCRDAIQDLPISFGPSVDG
jgi:Dickkopf N-terminal cysteine-rich region